MGSVRDTLAAVARLESWVEEEKMSHKGLPKARPKRCPTQPRLSPQWAQAAENHRDRCVWPEGWVKGQGVCSPETASPELGASLAL